MTTSLEFEVNDIEYITAVKKQVNELYQKQQIFSLSLETLELTRRFNSYFSSQEALQNLEAFELQRLISLTKHLERNLIREVQ